MVFIPFVSTFEKRKGGGGGKSSTCTLWDCSSHRAGIDSPCPLCAGGGGGRGGSKGGSRGGSSSSTFFVRFLPQSATLARLRKSTRS